MRYLLLPLILCALTASAAVDDDLLAAARSGNLTAAQAAIQMGAAIEAKTQYGQTPLFLAAIGGHQPVVKLLLDKGASADVQDTFYKMDVMAFTLSRKHFDIVKMLIAASRQTPDALLENFANYGDANILQAVLSKGKPSQKALNSALNKASAAKAPEATALLIKAGAEQSAIIKIDPKVLESYAGNYKSDQLPMQIKISAREGVLYVQATGQQEFAPTPESETEFEFAPASLQITFESPDRFRLKQGASFLFQKVVAQ
jgi:hypothetical protein